MQKSLIELVKSTLRALYFNMLGLIGTFLVSIAYSADLLKTTITVPALDFSLPVGVILAAGFTAVAKAIDLYVRNNENIDAKGIAPAFLQR